MLFTQNRNTLENMGTMRALTGKFSVFSRYFKKRSHAKFKFIIFVGEFLHRNSSGVLRVVFRKMTSEPLHLHHPLSDTGQATAVHVRTSVNTGGKLFQD